MQCHQCQGSLTPTQAKGRTVVGCQRCRYFWVPPQSADQELERNWVKANNFVPLHCPGCQAASLQLGSTGNSSVYRCGACGNYFTQFAPASAADAAVVLGWLGADLLAAFFS